MGFFKDLGDIKRQAKKLGEDSDPGARMQEMNAKITALNVSMAVSPAPPGPYAAPPAAAPIASEPSA